MNMQRGDKHMNSIMQSIRPKWCELIANGKKTIEVRKTRPKTSPPFKVYMYCTGGRLLYENFPNGNKSREIKIADYRYNRQAHALNGKVIGEYICDSIEAICERKTDGRYVHKMVDKTAVEKYAAMTIDELFNYAGLRQCYAWHISELVIYDKPKELGEFKRESGCKLFDERPDRCFDCNGCKVTRPPQDWFYVEELTC